MQTFPSSTDYLELLTRILFCILQVLKEKIKRIHSYLTLFLLKHFYSFKIGFSNSTSNVLAWATACLIDADTERPVAGQVAINFAHLHDETTSHIANTLIHEILHVMGFDPRSFSSSLIEKGVNAGKRNSIVKQLQHPIPRKLIIEPNLVKYARKYFDCPTLEGVALQASAGAGSDDSHWLFENLAEEIMAPYDTSIMQKLSMFTLILLNSTGWWHVESKEDGMTWGKGKGCAFLEINNITK